MSLMLIPFMGPIGLSSLMILISLGGLGGFFSSPKSVLSGPLGRGRGRLVPFVPFLKGGGAIRGGPLGPSSGLPLGGGLG